MTPQTAPVRVGAAITNWSTVAGGGYHTCATRTDGTLWCWGYNTSGQIGIGSVVSPQSSPVRIGAAITTWRSVTGGSQHTCATRTDNTVWCWGLNASGQLGLGDTTLRNSPVQPPGVVATDVHSNQQANHTFLIL